MNELSWLQKHERLILGVFILAVVFVLGNRWIDRSAENAHAQAAVAQQILQEQKEANEKLAAQLAQQSAAFEQERQAREQEIALLITSISVRDAASGTKIKEVKTATEPKEVLANLNGAYHNTLPTDHSAILADNRIAFPVPVVKEFTVTKIERDTAVADLKDMTTVADSRLSELNSALKLIETKGTMIDGLNEEIRRQGDASKKEIADVKAQARKSKRTWFIIGFLTGVGTRVLIHW